MHDRRPGAPLLNPNPPFTVTQYPRKPSLLHRHWCRGTDTSRNIFAGHCLWFLIHYSSSTVANSVFLFCTTLMCFSRIKLHSTVPRLRCTWLVSFLFAFWSSLAACETLAAMYLQRGPPIAENKSTTHRTHRTHSSWPFSNYSTRLMTAHDGRYGSLWPCCKHKYSVTVTVTVWLWLSPDQRPVLTKHVDSYISLTIYTARPRVVKQSCIR